MPDWLAVIILGIIEGVTEFLPISSTGHLLLAENSGLLPRQSELFNVVIQAGAVLAVFLVFSRRVKTLLFGLAEPETRAYLAKLAVAFVLTLGGVLVARKLGVELPKDPLAHRLGNGMGRRPHPGHRVVALRSAPANRGHLGHRHRRGRGADPRRGPPRHVAGGRDHPLRPGPWAHPRRRDGVLLPPRDSHDVRGQRVRDLQGLKVPSPEHTAWSMVALGTVVSAVVAFIVVRWLLRFIQSHTFVGFGWYRIVLGLLMVPFALR